MLAREGTAQNRMSAFLGPAKITWLPPAPEPALFWERPWSSPPSWQSESLNVFAHQDQKCKNGYVETHSTTQAECCKITCPTRLLDLCMVAAEHNTPRASGFWEGCYCTQNRKHTDRFAFIVSEKLRPDLLHERCKARLP